MACAVVVAALRLVVRDTSTVTSRATLIVYACPVGALAQSLARYFRVAAERFGPNEAHAYMPHITVTGFFHDTDPDLGGYSAALDQAMRQAGTTCSVTVGDLLLNDDFHGLTIESPWLQAVGSEFAARAPAVTRTDAVRPKDWLHLSLAYGFAPAAADGLAQLAREIVDPRSPCTWELRLYERHGGNRWVAHQSWPIRPARLSR